MKHKLLYSIFFSMLVVTAFLINTSPAEAAAEPCHKAGGKIVMGDTVDTTPVSIDGGDNYNTGSCEDEPMFYKMTGYKILLCTRDPYVAGGVSPNLNLCEAELVSGEKEIIIQRGEEADMLGGEDLLLPINSYKFGVMIASNHLGIKHIFHAVGKNGANRNVSGYKNNSTTYTDGFICYTKSDRTTTYSGTAAATWTSSDDVERTTVIENHQDPRTINNVCIGTKASEALFLADPPADWGYAYEIIDSIGSCSDNCGEIFQNHEDYYDLGTDLGLPVNGDAAFMILQNDNTVATNRTNGKKIGYFMRFDNPIDITEQTTGLKVLVSTSASVALEFSLDTTNTDLVQSLKVGANPFGVNFQTQTRRSRGAWR
jgi:hypothetical protein